MSAPSRPDPELEETARLLDEVAALEEREMNEAEALRDAPGLERVERVLSLTWGPAREPARAPAKKHWVLALVAAAAVFVLFLWRREAPGPEVGPRDEYLSDPELVIVAPAEEATRWDRIEWTGPADGTYRVTVRDAGTGAVVYGPVEKSAGTALPVAPDATARWPERILVELELRRADGTWTAAAPRESELRR